MKSNIRPEIKEFLKKLNELMDERISQLKILYPFYWWEASLKDEHYNFLCRRYAEIKIKSIEYNPSLGISTDLTDEEKKNLLITLGHPNKKALAIILGL